MPGNRFGVKKAIESFMNAQLIISVGALSILIVLNIYEIVMRGLFDKSLIWIQDISILLMCWMLFPGFSKIVYDKKDIVITILYDKLPKRVQVVLVDIILKLLVVGFTIIFSVFSYKLLVSQYGQGTITAHIPLVYYTGAVFLNAFSLFVINVEDLVATVTSIDDIRR